MSSNAGGLGESFLVREAVGAACTQIAELDGKTMTCHGM
jgi:hypothetical protein